MRRQVHRGLGQPEEPARRGYRWVFLEGQWTEVPEKLYANYVSAESSIFDKGCFRLTMIAFIIGAVLFGIVAVVLILALFL